MKANKIQINGRSRKLLLLILILSIVLIASFVNSKIKTDAALLGYEVETYEEYMESLKTSPSDIEGVSQYDKYEMGLDYRDGSDSDYDGLTDKEEVEVYGSDPLKSSTAGDLYSDGYKVKNEMDISKYYEYEKEVEFLYNECPEVKLDADEPTDFYASVEDYTDRYSLADYGVKTIYKGYWINNYNGLFCVDMSSVLEENSITDKDIEVWIYQGDFITEASELKRCKFSVENDLLTLDYELDNKQAYFVYITEDVSRFATLLSSAKNPMTQLNESSSDNVAFICGSPVLEQLFGFSGHIYYTESPNDREADSFMNRAINYSNTSVLGSEISSSDKSKLTGGNSIMVNMVANLYKRMLPMCEAKPRGEEEWPNFILNYKLYYGDDVEIQDSLAGSSGEDDDKKYYNNYHTDFDVYVDELPFQNFESDYSTSGNCSGITHYTAYLFNTGSAPTSGSYEDIEWDISGDKENETLTDRGLYDFKDKDFIDNNSGAFNNYISGSLTEGEKEFAKMIAAYWHEGNDAVYMKGYFLTDGQMYDWSLAEKMMDYLDQGKILCVAMLMKNGGGHEINIYDYYFTANDELIFRVYDSNIPQNRRDNMELTCDGACYIQCKKVVQKDGSSKLSYLYYPLKGQYGYMAASSPALMATNAFVVFDENWNVFNDK